MTAHADTRSMRLERNEITVVVGRDGRSYIWYVQPFAGHGESHALQRWPLRRRGNARGDHEAIHRLVAESVGILGLLNSKSRGARRLHDIRGRRLHRGDVDTDVFAIGRLAFEDRRRW